MKETLIILSCFFIFGITHSIAQRTTPQTITMDGAVDNITAFGQEGMIGSDKVTFFAHWDDNNLYLGWSGGNTNYSSDLYYAAIDTDPNNTNGITNAVEGVSFLSGQNTRKPDYYIVYENNRLFYGSPPGTANAYELYKATGSSWILDSRIPANDNINSRVDLQNSKGEVRIRIPWSVLGFNPGSATPLGLTMWTNDAAGNNLSSRYPMENASDGSTPKTLSYSFLFYNTSSGVNPSADRVIEKNTFTTGGVSESSNIGLTISGNVNLDSDIFLNSNLNILSGSTLNIGKHNLTIKSVSGQGTLTGSPQSNLTLASVGQLKLNQSSPNGPALRDLTVFDSTYVVLKSDLNIYGTLTIGAAASLDLNQQHVTFKSTINGSGRIAPIPNSSSVTNAENVTVEHLVNLRAGGTGRAWYLLAPSVNANASIRDNWMEGGMNIAIGANDNPVPSFGTQITGAGGNAHGFDAVAGNESSLYSIGNGLEPIFTPVGSTTGNLNALTGYFLLVRGDRSTGLAPSDSIILPAGTTILRTTGSLLTGAQTSFTNSMIGGGAFNLVTNPFVSPIDWARVKAASANITPYYTLWDPNLGSSGGFVTVDTTGNASVGIQSHIIESGQAFFVESDGKVPSVHIDEEHKTGFVNRVPVSGKPSVMSFGIILSFTEANGFRRLADGVSVLFNNRYSPNVDGNDAKEISNRDENIAIDREGRHLAIETRPVPVTKEILPIFMNHMKERAYQFEFIPTMTESTSLKAELVDNFLGTKTLLSLSSITAIPFIINSNPASSAFNRFSVLFSPKLL